MHIFTTSDAYDFDKFPRVSARKKQFKESEGGQKEVCDLVENYARERAEEAAKEAKKRADEAEKRADNAQKRADNAEQRVKELEARLAEVTKES